MVGVMHELAVAEDTVLGRVGADVDVAQRRNKRATGAAEPDERARLGVGEAEFVEIGSETLRYDIQARIARLNVEFRVGDGCFTEVYLTGPADEIR